MIQEIVIKLDETDIRDIISKHIKKKFKQDIKEIKIFVKDPKSIPTGAIPGDCVGMYVTL